MLRVLILSLVGLLVLPVTTAFAVPITYSDEIEKVEFDGRWSFEREWKASTRTELKTDDGTIFIKTAHKDEFIYVLLDVLPDKTFSKGMDKAIVCFENRESDDTKEKNYCFTSALNVSTGKTFESNGISKVNSNYKLIKNAQGFESIGGISDENDRYSKTPHVTYEYKIPIDLFGRSSMYGFYVYILDYDLGKTYTYPQNVLEENEKIPPTEKWATMISPDKTLPEFHLGIVLLIGIIPIIIMSYFRKNISFQA